MLQISHSPLAEQMRRHSPYNYAFDNPIYFIDYDGMKPSECCPNPVAGEGEGIARSVRSMFGPGSKIGSFFKSARTLVLGPLVILANDLGDPINVEGPRKSTSEEDRIDFRSEEGGGEGDTTDAPTLNLDGDVVIQAAPSGAGPNRKTSSDGRKFKPKTNKQKTLNIVRNTEKGTGKATNATTATSTIMKGNSNEPDSVKATAIRETNNIKITVHTNGASGMGGTTEVGVKVSSDKVDSLNNASNEATKNALARINNKIDSVLQTKN